MTLYEYKVGTPFGGTPQRWPEGPRVTIKPEATNLTLFYGNPTRDEVQDVKSGVPQWAWVDAGDVAVLCFRFGTMNWADMPFEVWRIPEDDRGVPAGGPADHLLTTTMLVDANNGTIRAIRAVTWPPAFAEAVRATIRRLNQDPPERRASTVALDRLYAEYSTERLVKERATARC